MTTVKSPMMTVWWPGLRMPNSLALPQPVRADLKAKQDETEVPAEDTEPGTEEQPEKVDEEIDSILSKLED